MNQTDLQKNLNKLIKEVEEILKSLKKARKKLKSGKDLKRIEEKIKKLSDQLHPPVRAVGSYYPLINSGVGCDVGFSGSLGGIDDEVPISSKEKKEIIGLFVNFL